MFEDGVDVHSKAEQVSRYGHVSSIITVSNGQEEPKSKRPKQDRPCAESKGYVRFHSS